jgi:hypothetical protein
VPIVSSTDRDEFERTLKWARFSPEDFSLLETAVPAPAHGSDEPMTGYVSIKRYSTGTARTYIASSGYKWLPSFKRDLDAAVFGKP